MKIPNGIRVYERPDLGHRVFMDVTFIDKEDNQVYSMTIEVKNNDIGEALIGIGKEYCAWLKGG